MPNTCFNYCPSVLLIKHFNMSSNRKMATYRIRACQLSLFIARRWKNLVRGAHALYCQTRFRQKASSSNALVSVRSTILTCGLLGGSLQVMMQAKPGHPLVKLFNQDASFTPLYTRSIGGISLPTGLSMYTMLRPGRSLACLLQA